MMLSVVVGFLYTFIRKIIHFSKLWRDVKKFAFATDSTLVKAKMPEQKTLHKSLFNKAILVQITI